ncbi:MAG: PilN domain-containing protein [Pseudomonadota bacterium]
MFNRVTKVLRSQAWFRQLSTFLSWWTTQLVDSLPPRLKGFFTTRQVRLLARMADDEVLLWRDGETSEELGRFRLHDDHEVARQAVQAALTRFDDATPQTVFLVEEGEVLIHQLNVPLAAEENLRQVLAFEMDKNTPFTAEQVCFDYRIVERTASSLRVELVAVPRPLIDRAVTGLGERGVDLHGIDVARTREEGVLALLGVNLLEPAQRARVDRRPLQINLGLAALLVLLLYGLMWQSLVAKEQAIEGFQARTADARRGAEEAAALRSELTEAREAASFLSERKASNAVVMEVLKSVTQAMPDPVWIQRLQVTQGKVQLTGQAPEAAAIIALLEEADCLKEPSPKGAFTPDAKSGKERFTIEVFVDECTGEEDADAAAG